jgi:hypothetical protein
MTVWLIVAAIFIHALLPAGSPLQRNAGSAFSATTVDVTTIPKRRDQGRENMTAASGEGQSTLGPTNIEGNGAPPVTRIEISAPIFKYSPPPSRQPQSLLGSDVSFPYQARGPPGSLLKV